MILSQIVAASQNGVIGNHGKLPWNIPEDLKWFHSKTKGHIVIMGRVTFECLPEGGLPNRMNIVITRQKGYQKKGAHVVSDFNEAVALSKQHTAQYGEEVFIGGGGEIYKETLPICDRLYLTLIHKDFEGDAFFPVKDLSRFKITERIDRDQPIPFSFLTYDKI